MCRRYFLALCVCLLLLVSCSVCLADSAAAPDDSITGEAAMWQLLGFDDEDSFYVFVDFLMTFPGETQEDMDFFLSDSEFFWVDSSAAFQIWELLSSGDYDIQPFVTPSSVDISFGLSQCRIRYTAIYNNATMTVDLYVPKGTATNNYTGYLADTQSSGSAWTTSDVSRLLNTQIGSISQQNSILYYLYRLDVKGLDLATALNTAATGDNTLYNKVSSISTRLMTDGVMRYINPEGTGYGSTTGNQYIGHYLYRMGNTLFYSLTTDTPFSWISSDGSSYTTTGRLNLTRVVSLISNTLHGTIGRGNSSYRTLDNNGGSVVRNVRTRNISEILSDLTNMVFWTNYAPNNVDYLAADGTAARGSAMVFMDFVRFGLLGLNANMETAFVGSHGHTATIDLLTFDKDLFPEELPEGEELPTVNNLLDAIVTFGNAIQRPVSQLQAVLANDDDLELRRQTQEQVDAVTKDFTGDGGSAPTVGDIGDMAGVSSGITDTFKSGISISDGFGVLNSDDSYSFFSQAVSDELTGNSAVAVDDEDFLERYDIDQDGFAVLKDDSYFSITDFLGRDLE